MSNITATENTAELAAILVEDAKAYADRMAECPAYSAYELRMMAWMMQTAEVRYTANSVMIRIPRRGRYSTSAYFAASYLLDGLMMANRTDGLGDAGNGTIVEIDANTWAIQY